MADISLNTDSRVVALLRFIQAALGSRDMVGRVWRSVTGSQEATVQLPVNDLGS